MVALASAQGSPMVDLVGSPSLCLHSRDGASNVRCTHSRGRSDRPQPSGSLHFKRGKNFWMPHAPQTRRELALPSTIVHPRLAPISSFLFIPLRATQVNFATN